MNLPRYSESLWGCPLVSTPVKSGAASPTRTAKAARVKARAAAVATVQVRMGIRMEEKPPTALRRVAREICYVKILKPDAGARWTGLDLVERVENNALGQHLGEQDGRSLRIGRI